MAVPIGEKIDAYVVRSVVDEGDLTTVFEVEHAVLHTLHAMKVLVDDDGGAFARSFLHGARLQALVDHAHVVRCTDAGTHDGRPWMVTDWMNGGSLGRLLDERGAMPIPYALRTFRAVARGLHAIHGANVVHRDLKPANVLFSVQNGRRIPRITDLALGKWLDQSTTSEGSGSTLSMEFRTIGTPEYMAPEQAADPAAVDIRADLYSLGVLLYEMLTNEVPFEAEDGWRTLVKARLGQYRPARDLRPEVPDGVEALVADLLKPTPGQRPAGCDAVLARLDDLIPPRPET